MPLRLVAVRALGRHPVGVRVGRLLTLLRRHVDLEQPHLWVVYPRYRNETVLHLPFLPSLKRPDRDNLIDRYIADGGVSLQSGWEAYFTKRPPLLTGKDRAEHSAHLSGVSLGSDAFFPFDDNIERARESGVCYVAQPGGSVRDEDVIAACDKYGMAMFFTGLRLFHH